MNHSKRLRQRLLQSIALACVLGFACSLASAQDAPPPPPPGQGPGNGMYPPPPPPGDGNGPRGRRPFPPPQMQGQQPYPPPQQQQQQQPPQQQQQPPVASIPAAISSTPAATSEVLPAASAGSPAVATQPASPAEIPRATVDPDAAAWATDAVGPERDHIPAAATSPAAKGTGHSAAPIERIVEMIPGWAWAVAVALAITLVLLIWSVRRQARLAEESEMLARHQRVLQSEQRTLKDVSDKLRHQATNDPLTGILNRRAFADELRALLDHLSKFARPLDLIVFDLDHFKQINDQQGHLAGDIALKLVAGIVHKHLRSDDLFGRFGGDEFLIACADRTPNVTEQIAETIRRAVMTESATCKPPLPGLSLSMGVARANHDSGYQLDALFVRADAALYVAKRGGRNRVVLASDDLPRPPAAETVTRQLA